MECVTATAAAVVTFRTAPAELLINGRSSICGSSTNSLNHMHALCCCRAVLLRTQVEGVGGPGSSPPELWDVCRWVLVLHGMHGMHLRRSLLAVLTCRRTARFRPSGDAMLSGALGRRCCAELRDLTGPHPVGSHVMV